jgi:putative ABC transport system permease protein
MWPAAHTSLAWCSLTHNKRRLAVSIAGVLCTVLMMFMQIGFLNALFDAQLGLLERLHTDLVVLGKGTRTLAGTIPFPRRRLEQALAVSGVAAVQPLYVTSSAALWRNPQDQHRRTIRVLAFDLTAPVLLIPELEYHRDALQRADTALFDVKSKPYYGTITPGMRTELAHRSLQIVGLFTLGTDFVYSGTVLMSERNFGGFFPRRLSPDGTLRYVDIGLLQLAPGVDPVLVQRVVVQTLPADVLVYTKAELRTQEMAYWQDSTPIGFVFTSGTAMGFVIGVIICYQLLFTDVVDHLPQFARLKAMGYTNGYLIAVVLQEALLLSCMGFLLGLGLTQVLYTVLAGMTGLPLYLTIGRVSLILLLTVALSMVAGVLAVRKVLVTDPAEVFA